MPERNASPPSVVAPDAASEPRSLSTDALRRCFREHYERRASFKEELHVAAELAREAEPALEALRVGLRGGEGPSNLHEAYALLTLLARKAALLGATPNSALGVADAVAATLRAQGVQLTSTQEAELRGVVAEGYCAARDEKNSAELRQIAAASQTTIALAPGCVTIVLAGRHQEADLVPVLEGMARQFLRQEAKSCLLELSKLELGDEDLVRAVGHFCALAATLGVAVFIVGAAPILRDRFEHWSIARHASLFVDDYQRGQALALAAAGFEIRPVRPWARLLNRHGRSVAP